MKDPDAKLLKYLCLPMLLGLLVFWALFGLFQAGEPNAELSRTVREVVKEALAVHRAARRVGLANSVLRIAALVVGVLGPLVLAYLVHRNRAHAEPTADEVLYVLHRHGLIDLESDGRLLNLREDSRLLREGKEDDDPSTN